MSKKIPKLFPEQKKRVAEILKNKDPRQTYQYIPGTGESYVLAAVANSLAKKGKSVSVRVAKQCMEYFRPLLDASIDLSTKAATSAEIQICVTSTYWTITREWAHGQDPEAKSVWDLPPEQLTKEQAKEVIAKYNKSFPEVKQYHKILQLKLQLSTALELLRWAQIPAESWYAFMVSRSGDDKGKKAYQSKLKQIKKLLK